jgi:8-oxo-dGTP pyrophosphatase MutT (NUDIX family)
VLLAKRASSLIEGGKWDLPGGLVDRDETLEQAVARELLEETGWQARDYRLARIRDTPDRPGDENRQNIVFIYFCAATERTGRHDWETQELRWFAIDALPPASEIAFDQLSALELFRRSRTEKMLLPSVA